MLRNLYERVLRLAAHDQAERWLAVISFAESSVFPIPHDALLVPMALARPDRNAIRSFSLLPLLGLLDRAGLVVVGIRVVA